MRIAFYAPLKSPNHAVPSGDRLMAQLLMRALNLAGHHVSIASELRAFLPDGEAATLAALRCQAEAERTRLALGWREQQPPDLWLCYHPYYKAPDLLGPKLSREFGFAYATAEASYSARRANGIFAETQAEVVQAIKDAACNICFTQRDREGLVAIAPQARCEMLAPFIEATLFAANEPAPQPGKLVAVAMMRKGDKLESYEVLAKALALLQDLPWSLTVIGDGPLRQETQALFSSLQSGRLVWRGEQPAAEIARELQTASLYVWPGCGEAYGLAYLEAQAAGVPVIAQHTAGVPEVVRPAETGLLTSAGDIPAYAAAIRSLLTDEAKRQTMAAAARRFVLQERSLSLAARRLGEIFSGC